jgi:hypothetical protein
VIDGRAGADVFSGGAGDGIFAFQREGGAVA